MMRSLVFSSALAGLVGLCGSAAAQQMPANQSQILNLLNSSHEVVGEYSRDIAGQSNTIEDACQQCAKQAAEAPKLNLVCMTESAGVSQGTQKIAVRLTSQRMVSQAVHVGDHLCSDILTVAGTEPPQKQKTKERVVLHEEDAFEPQY